MTLLAHPILIARLAAEKPLALVVDPMLETSQVGRVSIDLRLGYDFLVSVMTRRPSIALGTTDSYRAIGSYFQETRREIGERFVLYPNQVVLATTLEYVALPTACYADITSRSSFNRLGIPLSTWLQPGFRGCVPLELFNHGNSPVELVVGCRLCQMRVYEIDTEQEYLHSGIARKYFGEVRPRVSGADIDADLSRLERAQKNAAANP
jgi:dCTP deaminase